ncbi:hypothetical protein AAH979_35655 [Plantactinospora sp. ZYX-F-223]|uniref:hypothetical protein n=1 Tax=Plantactinospora sp. ZYX-F-223 TaxID=3144103 RepID=UPI0031FD8670
MGVVRAGRSEEQDLAEGGVSVGGDGELDAAAFGALGAGLVEVGAGGQVERCAQRDSSVDVEVVEQLDHHG